VPLATYPESTGLVESTEETGSVGANVTGKGRSQPVPTNWPLDWLFHAYGLWECVLGV
jgi:hypothetical protein